MAHESSSSGGLGSAAWPDWTQATTPDSRKRNSRPTRCTGNAGFLVQRYSESLVTPRWAATASIDTHRSPASTMALFPLQCLKCRIYNETRLKPDCNSIDPTDLTYQLEAHRPMGSSSIF